MTYAELREEIYNDKDAFEKLTISEKIAWRILENITDRRGWSQEWDMFDDEVKNEVFESFVKIAETELPL